MNTGKKIQLSSIFRKTAGNAVIIAADKSRRIATKMTDFELLLRDVTSGNSVKFGV